MSNKFVRNAALSLAFVGAVGGMTGCSGTYSDGDRVGTVTKISHKGITCKSWEGELAMENFKNSDGSLGNTFAFSVRESDTAVVKQLQDAQRSGGRVDLHYDQVLMNNPCTSDTDYYITSVTPAPKGPAQ